MALLLATLPARAENRAAELDYLRAALPEALLPFAGIEVPALENIATGKDGAGPYLTLRMIPAQRRTNSGRRAEISVDYPFQPGDHIRYEWRFRLHEDFAPDPRNRWWIMGQWHDQPDPGLGESWEGFPGHSPPVSFGYVNRAGHDIIALGYGAPDQRLVAALEVARGAWHHLRVDLRWSQGASGRVAVWLDGVQVARAQGANMHNGYQHYLKLGLYRHPAIRSHAAIDIAGVAIRRLD